MGWRRCVPVDNARENFSPCNNTRGQYFYLTDRLDNGGWRGLGQNGDNDNDFVLVRKTHDRRGKQSLVERSDGGMTNGSMRGGNQFVGKSTLQAGNGRSGSNGQRIRPALFSLPNRTA